MSLIRWCQSLVAILFVGAGWPLSALAQSSPQSACPNPAAPQKTAIYFINGVTTTLDEARLNGGKLEMEFVKQLGTMAPSVQAMCHQFFLNPNPTSGPARDLLEASQQRLNVTPTAFWRGLEGAGLYAPAVIQQALQGPMTDANQVDQAAIQRHVTAYRSQIASPSCRRVLLVPHSQGNLYANDSYDRVFNQAPAPPPGTLKIVGVATPDNEVKGSGRYRTSITDVVIAAIRLVLPSTLPGNTNWGSSPLLFSPTYSGGHSFIGYLSAEPSRTHILSDIESVLGELAFVNPC